MAVCLYAICGGEVQPPPGAGLHGKPLRMIRSGDLSAMVSDSPEASRREVGEAELWQHESAVEELMAAHDVLPVRFGEVLDSDAAVQEMLASRCDEFESALERVAGACELSVRAAWPQERLAVRRIDSGNDRGAAVRINHADNFRLVVCRDAFAGDVNNLSFEISTTFRLESGYRPTKRAVARF